MYKNLPPVNHLVPYSVSDTGGNSSDVSVATLFPGTASMDGTFTDDMNDPESEAFKNVERNFCEQVMNQSLRPLKMLNGYFVKG